jgi:hypothetical protein
MSEDWSAVAAEIEEAIASVGFAAVLETQCDPGGPEGGAEYAVNEPIIVIDDQIKRRDAGGMGTGTARMLTIKGNGTVPLKGWRVQVRGHWHRIAQVWPLAPGGVDLLFDLELEG